MRHRKKFISRRRAGNLFLAFAAVVLALALVVLLSPTTRSGIKPAVGAIHITTSAAVGVVPHSQALATTAPQQRSAIPGLSAIAPRDTLVVALFAFAALLATIGIALKQSLSFRVEVPKPSTERRTEDRSTLRSSSSTREPRRKRGLHARHMPVMTAFALGSLAPALARQPKPRSKFDEHAVLED